MENKTRFFLKSTAGPPVPRAGQWRVSPGLGLCVGSELSVWGPGTALHSGGESRNLHQSRREREEPQLPRVPPGSSTVLPEC